MRAPSAARPGEVTVLVGPNGSGKSTLLGTIARLRRPRAATLVLDADTDGPALSPREFSRRVALLTQGRPMPSGQTVRDVVEFGRYPYRSRWSKADPDGRVAVERALAMTGVTEVAGAALQAVSRNVLASPDTLAVNAGSCLALGLAAVTGTSLPLLASSGVAFIGGLVAAAVVLGLSGLGEGTVRLVLAGSALALGLTAVTEGLLLLFPERREGLFQWNQGSISQNGFDRVVQMAPIGLIGLAGLLLLAPPA
ncbi:iron chelate uptake ABC transporter family permease subunit [Streptomyces sp. NPDC007875]|uniref:iron chelate uptake ABC transporter family permease subunit n=1 Tax=Streptomyces sp. NPDC007875 TaxID=3364783 RepID=UPI0036AFC2E1